MSIWKTTMTWLGLGPDSEYEIDVADPRTAADPALREARHANDPGRSRPAVRSVDPPDSSEFSAVRALGPMHESGGPAGPSLESSGSTGLRPLETGSALSEPLGSVRPVPAPGPRTPQVIAPRGFNDAQEVADRFRAGSPVVLNLREVDGDLGRRLIDFCSGLCYGLRGKMERVGERTFLLTPADVQLTAEDHRVLRDSGLLSP